MLYRTNDRSFLIYFILLLILTFGIYFGEGCDDRLPNWHCYETLGLCYGLESIYKEETAEFLSASLTLSLFYSILLIFFICRSALNWILYASCWLSIDSNFLIDCIPKCLEFFNFDFSIFYFISFSSILARSASE